MRRGALWRGQSDFLQCTEVEQPPAYRVSNGAKENRVLGLDRVWVKVLQKPTIARTVAETEK